MRANSLAWYSPHCSWSLMCAALLVCCSLQSLMHVDLQTCCSLQSYWRVWCVQTHSSATYLNILKESDARKLTGVVTDFKVLEEFDACSTDSLVWYFTSTFFKSLVRADSLVYYSLQSSWRVWCTQRRLTGVVLHRNILEELDACRLAGVLLTSTFLKSFVHRLVRVLLTSTFLKSLMRADSLVSTMVMRSLRSTGTSAPLTSTPI